MSVRQDKKSRKIKRDIDKHMRVIQRKIKADNEKFTPMIIDLYSESLRKLPLIKRLIVAIRIIFKR